MSEEAGKELDLNATLAELVSAIIRPGITFAEMYQIVLQKSQALTESQHGFVSSIDPKTNAHVSDTLTEMRKDVCSVSSALYALPEGPHHFYHGLWGHSLNTREAYFTNHPGEHPAARGLPEGHVPLINFLSAPVMFAGELLGQIALANSSRDYTQEDLEVISKIGKVYAIVLHNKQQENELRNSEERFRLMIDGAPFPIVVCGLEEYSILYSNQLAASFFNISQEEAMLLKITDFYVVQKERLKMFAELRKQGRVLGRELQLKNRKGQIFWVIVSAVKMEWFGKPVVMVAINDISARKKMEEELQRLATTDTLTGILNRRQFFILAEQEVERSRRYGRTLALLLYDIDHFKQVNDTFGHQAGDIVLRELAKLVHEQLRRNDIEGRVGGEEFAVLLPETTISEAVVLAERIRRIIENFAINIGETSLHITASFGVTAVKENDVALDSIYKRADSALYEAKNAGRNRVGRK
ncbi:diguanylate cyclase [Anaeroarcus burkinensis]|uniref:diguanylate cyclase n=1 Tax=Anaeroarcus burkinensis TaxID=82376 RepID=UPI0004055516|nr:diguanylate cyclase [Anaeroarcus burkinensis]